MTKRKTTDLIVIHCAATKPGMDIGAAEIRKWHVEERGWSDIGYHFVIRRSGTIEKGRNEDQIGAHAAGHNSRSVAVCMVGGLDEAGKPAGEYTPSQWAALSELVDDLQARYPGARVIGHRDLPKVNKACPSFDVAAWMASRATQKPRQGLKARKPDPATTDPRAPIGPAAAAVGLLAAVGYAIYEWWEGVWAWIAP